MTEQFQPMHINASADDFLGNNGIGRYIFLPGSDGRAKEIATHFEQVTVKNHSRGHHLYLGTLKHGNKNIDVAAMSSGMGTPSMEIILHELFKLGGKRFLRVGTAGSLQSNRVKIGHLVNVQASVRDEHTTRDYAPIELPAVASLPMLSAVIKAAEQANITAPVHTGTVHCKSSFYAREFGAGAYHAENHRYLELLENNGVLASEMETSALLIQAQYYHHLLQQTGQGPAHSVYAGAVLAILAEPPAPFVHTPLIATTIEQNIALAISAIKVLAESEIK